MPHEAPTTRAPARASRAPASVEAYLAQLDDEWRVLLAELRRTIRAVPGAVECFGHGMPGFRVDGRVVAGFQATARGGSFYPFTGAWS